MSNLTIRTETGKPPAASPEQRELISRFSNALEKTPAGNFQIAERLPSAAEREALEMRRDALRAGMAKAAPRELASEIAGMFLRFPSASRDGGNTEGQVAAYVDTLKNYPLWAVRQAIAKTARGATFPPSAMVVAKEAENATSELLMEGMTLSRVLSADVYHEPTLEERERVKAGFEKLLRDLALNRPLMEGK